MPVPQTLGEWRDFCVYIDGEDSPATKYFDNKIALQGRDEKVLADESQMIALISSLLHEKVDDNDSKE